MSDKIGNVTVGMVGDQKLVVSGDWVYEMLKQGVAAGVWSWYLGSLVITALLGLALGLVIGLLAQPSNRGA